MRRPTLWVELGVALTWIALALGAWFQQAESASGSGLPGSSAPLWLCTMGMANMGSGLAHHAEHLVLAGNPTAFVATMPMLALMTVAMMVPTAMPAIRHVAVNSLYWRRRRAVLEFLAVYVGIWVTFSLLVLGTLSSWGSAASPAAPVAALGVAVLWQLTPVKRWALLACHRARPLPPRGLRATLGVADFGFRNGIACLASCWAMMLTTAFVGLPRLLWMAALTGLIATERMSLKPRRASRRIGAALGAATIAAAVLALT